MSLSDGPDRISVSRDAMRADMAELELRLQAFIRGELASKADRSDVVSMATMVTDLNQSRQARDRGEFTPAQVFAMRQIAKDASTADDADAWTVRQQWLYFVSVVTAFAALVVSVAVAVSGGVLG